MKKLQNTQMLASNSQIVMVPEISETVVKFIHIGLESALLHIFLVVQAYNYHGTVSTWFDLKAPSLTFYSSQDCSPNKFKDQFQKKIQNINQYYYLYLGHLKWSVTG